MSDVRVQVDSQFGGCVIVLDSNMGPQLIVQNDEGLNVGCYIDHDKCERIGKALLAIAMLHQATA